MSSPELPELLFYEIVEENTNDLTVIPQIIFSTPDETQAREYFERLQKIKENDGNEDVLYRFVTSDISEVVGYRAYCYWPLVQTDLSYFEDKVQHMLLNPVKAEDIPKLEYIDFESLTQQWAAKSTLTDHLENGPFIWCYGYSLDQAKTRLKERLQQLSNAEAYLNLVSLLKERQALWNRR